MKRKLAFLPLVLVAPILASCGGVKAPKFASEGNKVEASVFSDDFAKALQDFNYYKEDKVGSTYIKVEEKEEETEKVNNGKLVLQDESSLETATTIMKSDVDNLLASGDEKKTEKSSAKTPQGKITNVTKSNEKFRVQEAEYDNNKFCIAADVKQKLYSPILQLGEDRSMADAIDFVVKLQFAEYYLTINNILTEYSIKSDEDKAKYAFYENGTIFTITFENKVENEEKKVDDEVYRIDNDSTSKKWQIDLSNEKFAFKYYGEEIEKEEYKKNHSDHAVGEVRENVKKESVEVSAQAKKNKLKPIKLEGFIPVEF